MTREFTYLNRKALPYTERRHLESLRDISTYTTVETKEEFLKIILHNIDKETL